jgi:hypothetical protein
VFGSMLAITGCGDEGSTGSGATGGGGSASICDTICLNCGSNESQCRSACEDGLGDTGGIDLESCPTEQAALGSCVQANGCQNTISQCATQFQAWVLCVSGVSIPF